MIILNIGVRVSPELHNLCIPNKITVSHLRINWL